MPENRAKVRKPASKAAGDPDMIDSRLEKARIELLAALTNLRAGTLSQKEADAIEAAIEDELIALRVGLLRSARTGPER